MNVNKLISSNSPNFFNNRQPRINKIEPKPINKANPNTKFWGIWLPVPTFLAIVNSLFWTWLILNTVGYTEGPIEKAGERIIEQF
jgi:hypothetical protein